MVIRIPVKYGIGKGYRDVIEGKALDRLYKEREAADPKQAEKKQAKEANAALPKPPPITPTRPHRVNRVTIQSPIEIESSPNK